MMLPKALVQVRWLTTAEGGRSQPFAGVRYTPTARFAGERDQFSVVLEFSNEQTNPSEGKLSLLFPDNQKIQRRIIPGCQIEIMEGSRTVAHCEVLSLEMENRERAKV